MTTTHVDLDLVLTVAGELRRLCQRAVRTGVRYPVFKQESWDAAFVHVQDHAAGRQPRLASDEPFYRLLAYVPRPAWRWEHLDCLQEGRVFDGRGQSGNPRESARSPVKARRVWTVDGQRRPRATGPAP